MANPNRNQLFFLIATQTRQIPHFYFNGENFSREESACERSATRRRRLSPEEPAEKYFCKMVDIVKTRD